MQYRLKNILLHVSLTNSIVSKVIDCEYIGLPINSNANLKKYTVNSG